jgi:hypothetical protein
MIVRMIVMRVGCVRMSVMSMIVAIMAVRMIHSVAARVSPVRAKQSDQSCEDSPQQWQEDNGLNHFNTRAPA